MADGKIEARFFDPGETDVVTESEDSLQSTVHRMVQEAQSWREENLDPDQTEATDYYMGRPFGNEEAGRSSVVMTVVRDTVQALMPSLMRIFFSSDRVVEYRPKGLEDEELAEQQTDYINHVVIQQDNPGFLTTHSVFKDALVRRIGVVKWWWDEKVTVEGREFTGLTSREVDGLIANPDIEDLEVSEPMLVPVPNQMPVQTFDVTLKVRSNEGRARFMAVPPEEFIHTPDARSEAEAPMIGHIRPVSASDLVAMGIDRDLVEDHAHQTIRERDVSDGDLWAARRQDEGAEDRDMRAPGAEEVLYGEIYIQYDRDDDGIAELLKVPVIGKAHEVIEDMVDMVDEVPFAIFTPDPEPHTMIGLSMADYTMDLQRVMSALVRGALDSMTLALHPRTEVDINRVEIEDVLNEEMGGIIRSDGVGNIQPVQHDFIGRETLPLMDRMDSIRETRTGTTKAGVGLAPDALQSSTRAAVAATVEGGRQHIEMIARVFAETGMKRLYRGLYKLVKENQDFARVVRLRGRYVEVDPRDWDAEMDVVVNVALGGPVKEERIQMLTQIIADQKEQLLAGSPLVDLVKIRNSLADAVELAGFKPDRFYNQFGAEELQAWQKQQAEQAQQQSQADPEMALVEVERERVQAEIQLKQQKAQQEAQMHQLEIKLKEAELKQKAQIDAAKVELEQQKAAAEDDRERDELAQDFAIEQAKIEAKHAVDLEDQKLRADIERGKQSQGDNPSVGG